MTTELISKNKYDAYIDTDYGIKEPSRNPVKLKSPILEFFNLWLANSINLLPYREAFFSVKDIQCLNSLSQPAKIRAKKIIGVATLGISCAVACFCAYKKILVLPRSSQKAPEDQKMR